MPLRLMLQMATQDTPRMVCLYHASTLPHAMMAVTCHSTNSKLGTIVGYDGYTVPLREDGAPEGWTPSTFVSSRSSRIKDGPQRQGQEPENFMDDEDLVDAAANKPLQATDRFNSFGWAGNKARGSAPRYGGKRD
ncbi:G patch domain-containing protein 1 [Colletotrichum trifolii]|uniref:G patch domain-containing protein 1 n=1 Tax=Colletotrichum trifolii TaxID=5466 RepID=A0A4R8Q325_COLTR|nr:G patch domain-containing protein 1 [Colletotrichum trifolii]